MDRTNQQKLLSELNEKINDYQNQIESRIIEQCPFIAQVGALTITIDSSGVVTTQNTCFPTQFSQTAIDEILTMTFRNGMCEKVIPKIYPRNNWYLEKITELKETCNLINSI